MEKEKEEAAAHHQQGVCNIPDIQCLIELCFTEKFAASCLPRPFYRLSSYNNLYHFYCSTFVSFSRFLSRWLIIHRSYSLFFAQAIYASFLQRLDARCSLTMATVNPKQHHFLVVHSVTAYPFIFAHYTITVNHTFKRVPEI